MSSKDPGKAAYVLIIEDERPIALLLQTIVRGLGHESAIAGDGAAGLAEAHRRKPDLILLDMILPIMSGWEFLKAAENDTYLAGVPIVLVSTVDRVEQELQNQYRLIAKPFGPDTVRRAVTETLGT